MGYGVLGFWVWGHLRAGGWEENLKEFTPEIL